MIIVNNLCTRHRKYHNFNGVHVYLQSNCISLYQTHFITFWKTNYFCCDLLLFNAQCNWCRKITLTVLVPHLLELNVKRKKYKYFLIFKHVQHIRGVIFAIKNLPVQGALTSGHQLGFELEDFFRGVAVGDAFDFSGCSTPQPHP